MGIVYEAYHTKIGRQVALKVLHSYLSYDEEMVTRLLQEAHTSNLVQHPGVVQITDHHRQRDGTTYLVMEFLRGESLRRLELDGNRVAGEEVLLSGANARIRDVRQGPDGLLYVLTDSADGQLLRLRP